MIKKADIILVVSIIAAFGIVVGVFFLFGSAGKKVVVKQDGAVVAELSLNTHETRDFTDADGCNTVVVSGGKAWVESADCRDQICVNHKSISKEGEIIVCLPHKFTVEIK